MKNDYILTPFVKRLHAFSAMLLMMLCFSAPAQSKETAIAYLANTQGSNLKTLIFEYKDISGYNYEHSWTGDKILNTSMGIPWAGFASQIGQVWIDKSFKSQTPKTVQSWFEGCENLKEIKGIENLNTSKVGSMSYLFKDCSELTSLNLKSFDTSNLQWVRGMFAGCSKLQSIDISTFKTSQIRSYEEMFKGCSSLSSLSFDYFDFGNVGGTTISSQADYMFAGCESLKSINLTKFKNTSNLNSMAGMFMNCKSLESLSFPESFDTSNVTDMQELFRGCEALTFLNLPESFNTSNVTNMLAMFRNCYKLPELDLKYFNTAKVEDMGSMFENMHCLEKLNIRSFQTDNVKKMDRMFYNCYRLKKLDLHNFKTNNVEEMDEMFSFCSTLTNIYSGSTSWNTSASSTNMFKACTSLKGAITYSDSKVNNAYANPTTGYFTKTEYIGVYICGERVSNANSDDLSYIKGVEMISKWTEGAHLYLEGRNLYIKNIYMTTEDESCIEVTDGTGLKICVEKEVRLQEKCTSKSKIKPVISLMGNNIIENSIYTPTDVEPGILLVDGRCSDVLVPAIVSTGPLSLYRTDITATGSYGICGGTEGVGPRSTLVIGEDTNVYATGSEGGSICNFNMIVNWGMVTYPKGAFDDEHAVVLNGEIVKSMVAIGKAVYGYGIYICGEEVNSANCDDLSVINGVTVGDIGYIRFNFATNTLEMENVVIAGGQNYGLRNTFKNLKIKVGHGALLDYNWIGSDDVALCIDAPTTIVGNGGVFKDDDGCLIAYTNKGTAIKIGESGELTIEDASVGGIGKTGIDGIKNGSKLNIRGLSRVVGGSSSENFSIGNLYQLNLGDHIKITSPYGANFSDNFVRDRNGSIVKGENVIISYYNPADVNLDQEVNISDVVAVINTIAGDETFKSTADVNSDNNVDISDVVAVINVMAGGEIPLPRPTSDAATKAGYCPDTNHPHVIDLGSAGKWSCCNVGASAPWEYGGYYAWGETEEKSTYTWGTYKHCDGSKTTIHDIGTNIAGTQYDVAHMKWGGNWQMPNYDQGKLLTNCSGELTTLNNVPGRKYIGSNGNFIFLPAPGIKDSNGLRTSSVNVNGWYWTSVPIGSTSESVYGFWFYYDSANTVNSGAVSSRLSGLPVRPVSK